jgi:hypothetical protein
MLNMLNTLPKPSVLSAVCFFVVCVCLIRSRCFTANTSLFTVGLLEDWDVNTPFSTRSTAQLSTVSTRPTSPVISLITGSGHFTLNPLTAIPFPKGTYSLPSTSFSIMDDQQTRKIPLSEVYGHHWLVGLRPQKVRQGAAGPLRRFALAVQTPRVVDACCC